MRIILAGASGLVGSALSLRLAQEGNEILRLVRTAGASPETALWAPDQGELSPEVLEDADAVVCLSGAGIADRRWSDARRKELLDSRVDPASLLAQTLADHRPGPRTFVCASAIGYYGAHNGEQELDESSNAGDDFLARLCVKWEAAAKPARSAGLRVVHLRLGIVLTPTGGALKRMIPAFRTGLAGRLGSGAQYMSWVTLEDVLRAISWCLRSESAQGAYNVTAPNPVTNAAFTRALGAAVHRPAIIPVPQFAIRLALGQMGEDLLLGSTRVLPRRLQDERFEFAHANLEDAFRAIL